ncbi:MAG: hypothetical protein JSU86_09300 [Phycisphaerales bacterium]|nr:MAG: hypothetical protein JSU86_09300 [Phycisphaerales bacterium]
MLTRSNCCVAAIAVMVAVTGCRKEPPAKERAKSDAETQSRVVAKLAKADEYDGTIDHIVSKCPNCALHMDGTHEHVLQVSGYTLRFCAEHCKKEYEKDTANAILALKIPED